MPDEGVESKDAEADTVVGAGSKGVVEADSADGVESIFDVSWLPWLLPSSG